MRRVWSDLIFSAERQYLLRMLAWSALSVLLGTLVVVLLTARRLDSPLLKQFALQTVIWGLVVAAVAMASWKGLHLRDVGGAARLERVTWMRIGLDIGGIGVGATLAITGYRTGRRMQLIGAGVGVVVQAMALLLMDLQFAGMVSR